MIGAASMPIFSIKYECPDVEIPKIHHRSDHLGRARQARAPSFQVGFIHFVLSVDIGHCFSYWRRHREVYDPKNGETDEVQPDIL